MERCPGGCGKKWASPQKIHCMSTEKYEKKDLWRKKNPTKQTQNNVNFGCEMNHQNTAYQVISSDPLFSPSWRSLCLGHVFTISKKGTNSQHCWGLDPRENPEAPKLVTPAPVGETRNLLRGWVEFHKKQRRWKILRSGVIFFLG